MAEPKGTILLTGSSGLLGPHLRRALEQRGWAVYGLSRHGSDLRGDVTLPGLGLGDIPQLDAIFHAAAAVKLGRDSASPSLWRTNVEGTRNVIEFALHHSIPRLFFVSTAYVEQERSRNPYEESKKAAEGCIDEAQRQHGLITTIFRPSILVDEPADTRLSAFLQFVLLIVRMRKRLKRLLRIRGDGEARLNLIPVNAAADFMAESDRPGLFWVTSANGGPKLSQLAEWVGDELGLEIEFSHEFTPTTIERAFHSLAYPFLPYLDKIELPSDLNSESLITEEFIRRSVTSLLY